MTTTENFELPEHFLDRCIKSGNELGWRQEDVINAINCARGASLATIGGQVQYITPAGTFELYWLNYYSSERKDNEDWLAFCERSLDECVEKFNAIIQTDIKAEAINSFPILKDIPLLDNYRVFILYFHSEKQHKTLYKKGVKSLTDKAKQLFKFKKRPNKKY